MNNELEPQEKVLAAHNEYEEHYKTLPKVFEFEIQNLKVTPLPTKMEEEVRQLLEASPRLQGIFDEISESFCENLAYLHIDKLMSSIFGSANRFNVVNNVMFAASQLKRLAFAKQDDLRIWDKKMVDLSLEHKGYVVITEVNRFLLDKYGFNLATETPCVLSIDDNGMYKVDFSTKTFRYSTAFKVGLSFMPEDTQTMLNDIVAKDSKDPRDIGLLELVSDTHNLGYAKLFLSNVDKNSKLFDESYNEINESFVGQIMEELKTSAKAKQETPETEPEPEM